MADQLKPLVQIRDLRLEVETDQGTAHILCGVDLEIGRGRVVGVVGESGAGKSSLARALLGLLPPNTTHYSGSIKVDGVDLRTLSRGSLNDWRGRRIAMVFQDPAAALNPSFRIGTQLRDVVRRRDSGISASEAIRKIKRALVAVELNNLDLVLRAYPHELSGGMRQRVMIAMALLVRPDLLLADEPTASLDATIAVGIVELLRQMHREHGCSILFISHHLGLAANFSDELAVIYGGQVVESGPASQVSAQPRHPYSVALLACEPHLSTSGAFAHIAGRPPDLLVAPKGCTFASRCPLAEARCFAESQYLRVIQPGWKAACWKRV